MENFKIVDISITNMDGKSAVIATLTTKKGSIELLEWLNNKKVDRQNSHIT